MKLFALLMLATLVSGCASTTDNVITQTVCSHQIATTAAAELALQNAGLIKDVAARDAAIAAANATLSIVAGCPGYGGPIPITPVP